VSGLGSALLEHAPHILTGVVIGALSTWLRMVGRLPRGAAPPNADELRAVGKGKK
jgi:hypothetical protein